MKKRDMGHAVHETGHAVMRWALGHSTDAIRLLSGKQFSEGVRLEDRRGRVVADAIGHCDGNGIGCLDVEAQLLANPSTPQEIRQLFIGRFYQGLKVDCAGYVAEAKFRGIDTSQAIADGGESDYVGMMETARAFAPYILSENLKNNGFSVSLLIFEQQEYATRLFSVPVVWSGLLKIAKMLAETGEVLGDDVQAIMDRVTGTSFNTGREFLA